MSMFFKRVICLTQYSARNGTDISTMLLVKSLFSKLRPVRFVCASFVVRHHPLHPKVNNISSHPRVIIVPFPTNALLSRLPARSTLSASPLIIKYLIF